MFGNQEHTLWVEIFRPSTLDGYVGNAHIVDKVKLYLESGDVPHLLFHGKAGTGKTTLAKIIANNIDADVMYINASDENNVETVRSKIKNFASTVGFRKWKLIVLDEADYLTGSSQAALRNLMETFSKTTRFILTCNYKEKIISPIQSRCQSFHIEPPNRVEVAKRIAKILQDKNVEYVNEDLATIINLSYPDIRSVLNSAQRHVIDGKLVLDETSIIQSNYILEIIEILKNVSDDIKGNFTKIRQLIADSKVKDFTQLYSELFKQVDVYGSGHVGPIILILADAQYKDSFAIDKELHVMSMVVQLLQELNE